MKKTVFLHNIYPNASLGPWIPLPHVNPLRIEKKGEKTEIKVWFCFKKNWKIENSPFILPYILRRKYSLRLLPHLHFFCKSKAHHHSLNHPQTKSRPPVLPP